MQRSNNNNSQEPMDNNKESVSCSIDISFDIAKPKPLNVTRATAIYKKSQGGSSFDYFGSKVSMNVPTHQNKSKSEPSLDTNIMDIGMVPLSLSMNPLLKNDDYASSPSSFTPPSLVPTQFSFDCHNELNSFIIENDMEETTPKQVIAKLEGILLENYSADIEFTIDHINDCIRGRVFMSNCYVVSFVIQVWTDMDNNKMGFEFQRFSGDSMASAKFWASIQSLYSNKDCSFILLNSDLPMDFDFANCADLDSKQNENRFSPSELDEINDCIAQNDQFSIDELCILHDRITETLNTNDKNEICKDILNHEQLIHTLISTINNADIAMQRISLLILKELCVFQEIFAAENAVFIFSKMAIEFKNGSNLIRRHCIDFLSKLSLQSSTATKKWNSFFSENCSRSQFIELIDECEIDFKKDLFLNQIMFDNIKRKFELK